MLSKQLGLPAHHIYGFLFTAMLSDMLGLETVSADHVGPGSLARGLRIGDLIVTIPDYWRWLNKTLPRWPEDICGVVSTAPCPAELIRSLMQKGLNHMTEIYGSSETSGIGVRAWPDKTYRLMPHWKCGCRDDLGQTDLIHASGNPISLMDQIDFLEDGTFLLAGRQDGAVQVGGTNVYPAQIATLLLARPSVAEVAFRLMRPEEGNRLKAFIVPAVGVSIDNMRRDLEYWIEKFLIVVERPKAMKFGPVLPINSPDKALDW